MRVLLAGGLVLFMIGCDDDDDDNGSGSKAKADIDKTVYDFTVPSYQEGADCNPDTFNQFCDGKKAVSCNSEKKVEINECFETNITEPDCIWYQQKNMPHSIATCGVANFNNCSSVGETLVDCNVQITTQTIDGELVKKNTYKRATTVCAKTNTGKEYITYKTDICEESDTACVEMCQKQSK